MEASLYKISNDKVDWIQSGSVKAMDQASKDANCSAPKNEYYGSFSSEEGAKKSAIWIQTGKWRSYK